MEEYKSNSHKFKEMQSEERPKVEKMVKGQVVQKEKSLGEKIRDSFLPDDVTDVKSYLIFDVAIPALKDLVSDLVCKGTDAVLYGESRGRSKPAGKTTFGNATYINYNTLSSRKPQTSTQSTRMSSNDIVLADKGEAEAVLDNLIECVDKYGMVSVGDLYDLVGISAEHTDYKYGWTNLTTASVSRVREGYLIKLPRATAL